MFSKIVLDCYSGFYFLADSNDVKILALESQPGVFKKANELFMSDLKDVLELLDINVIQVFEQYSGKKFDAEFACDLTLSDYLIWMQKVSSESFNADDSGSNDFFFTFYNKKQLFQDIFDEEEFQDFTDVHFKYISVEVEKLKNNDQFKVDTKVTTTDDF